MSKSLTLGSFFDGIGGWLLAAKHTGVKPVWASEIDDFPATVSAYHFPQVKQLGDITKINVDELEPVDIICAGSPCFVAGTRILTFGGMKAVEDVKVGNAVLGDDCKWHKVVKTMVNPASVIYTIKAQGLLDTKATANHPIYVRHMKRHYPTYEDGRRGNERVFSKPEYVAVKDLKKGDFIGFPILQYENNRMNVTPEEAWLVGRYIADGYVNNNQRSNRPKGQYNHKVIYCIGKGKVEHFKAHVEKYHVCLKKDATVTKGEIISERLMFFCMMCGKGAEGKEIPGDFLNLPKNLLKALIEGYMSGDGCKRNGINKATTISRDLALSLQVAVHKVYGVPAKIYFTKRPPKTVIQGREVNQHDTYQVTWLDKVPNQSQAIVEDGYIWQPIRKVTKEEVKTSVYNFEVKDVHSYTANGMMVHNCQDLSVAGKREGLNGERSGLFRTAIELVHRLRKRTGSPRYFVWENVPGAISSNKGLDFRAVLEEITKAEIPMPKDNKWADSGMVEWDGGSLAWRTLDAQYWGVPQRRKRIFLVADFTGHSAGEILFEPQGLPRNPAESQGTGEEAAGNARTSIDSASKIAYSFDSKSSNSMKSANPYSGCRQVEIAKCLDTTIPDPSKNQGGIAIYKGVGNQFVDEGKIVVGSLCAHDGRGFNGQDVEQNKVVYPAGKVRRLTTTECERLQGLPDEEDFVLLNLTNEKVVFVKWLDLQKNPARYAEDKCHKKQRFVGIAERSRLLESVLSAEKNLHSSNQKINKPVQKSAPINSEEYVQEIHSLWERLRNVFNAEKISKSLLQNQTTNFVQSNVPMNIEKENIVRNGEMVQQNKEKVKKEGKFGISALEQFGNEIRALAKDVAKPIQVMGQNSQFTILDLTEIVQIQGMLPKILSFFAQNVITMFTLKQEQIVAISLGIKGYTDIEFNGKPAPDSRRYKAIGNGMAQPCADFVIRRITEVVSNET